MLFSISIAFPVNDFRLHICSNSFSCHNVFIPLSLSDVTNLSLNAGVCAACMLAYRHLQIKWLAAVTVVAIPLQKALLMCPYVSSSNFSVLRLAPLCSCALLHNLQPTSDRCLILASHLATGMIPAPSFASSPRTAFTLTKKIAVPAAILFRSISMAAARISASGAPTNVAFPPSPIHLLTALIDVANNARTDCHANTAMAPLSACHEAPENAANSGRFELEPSSSRPTLHYSFLFFSFSSYYILLQFCPLCLNRHLLLLGPETHSLQACLSLCPSSNRVLSLSIALDICLFLLILWPLSSKLIFARLLHGNLGEPNTNHTLRSLRIWCCSVATTLSSALIAHCLLSYPSSLLLWLLFACCVLRRFSSIGFKRALILVFFPRPAPDHPILDSPIFLGILQNIGNSVTCSSF